MLFRWGAILNFMKSAASGLLTASLSGSSSLLSFNGFFTPCRISDFSCIETLQRLLCFQRFRFDIIFLNHGLWFNIDACLFSLLLISQSAIDEAGSASLNLISSSSLRPRRFTSRLNIAIFTIFSLSSIKTSCSILSRSLPSISEDVMLLSRFGSFLSMR